MPFFALFFLASVVEAASIADATAWFHEDASTFAENTAGAWRSEPGVARTNDNKVVVSLISFDGDTALSELVYTPQTAPAAEKMVIGEHALSFDGPGDDAFDAGDAFVGVQILEVNDAPGTYEFAVLNGLRGSWVRTGVAAMTNVDYVVRVEADTTVGCEVAAYFVKAPDAADFTKIADVALPVGVAAPGEVVHIGNGSMTEMDLATAAGGSSAYGKYRNWAYADRIMTYKGGSGLDYCEWIYKDGAWKDGTQVWSGDEAVELFSTSAIRYYDALPATYYIAGNLMIGGLIVEAGAKTYTIQQSGNNRWTTGLGDPSGETETFFLFNKTFTINRRYAAMTLYGVINVTVTTSGHVFHANRSASSYPTKLDQATHTRLKCHGAGQMRVATLDATGAVTLDFSDLDPKRTTPFIYGNIKIDDATTIVLPAGINPGDSYQLCTGTLSGYSSASSSRTISVGGKTFSAVVTFSGNNMSYQPKTYGDWSGHRAVFTWSGDSDYLPDGSFALFDPSTGTDSSTNYLASGAYSDVPGWEGSPVNQFWWIFSGHFDTGASLPLALGRDYALRFLTSAGSLGDLKTPEPHLNVSGLLVEGGAVGYRLAGDSGVDDVVSVGQDGSTWTNRVQVDENFGTVGKAIEFVGRVDLSVASGKCLDVSGSASAQPSVQSPEIPAELRFEGSGVATCSCLRASGAVTLDYSAQSVSRTTPFVSGTLEIDDPVRLVLPSALASGAAFTLCKGTLSASDGLRALALGDGEYFFANTTFDRVNGTVSYTAASVNSTSLDTDVRWEDVSWSGGYDGTKPVVITLTSDVRLTFDKPDVQLPDLLVLGAHKLSIAGVHLPSLGKTFVGREAKLELVIDTFTDVFGSVYTVPTGVPYETVIAASSSEAEPSEWRGRLLVDGRLRTTGYLRLVNEDNAFEIGSVITVASGRLETAGACDSVTFNIAGELSLCGGDWNPTAATRINFLPGGKLVGGENASLNISEPMMVTANGAGDATFGIPLVCDAPVALSLDNAASAFAFASTNSAFGLDGWFGAFGAGSVTVENPAVVAFAGESFPTGGLFGDGTVIFNGDPTESGVCASLTDVAAWQGVCWLRGATLNAFDPGLFGHADSVVKLEGCNGYFAKDASYAPALELATSSTEFPVAFSVNNGFAGAEIPLDRLTGDGKLELEENPHDYAYRVFIPSKTAFTGSLSVVGTANRNAIVIGVENDERRSCFDTGAGMISILRGTSEISRGASWGAANGISLAADATLVDGGNILSPMQGSGLVKYPSGEDGQPERAATYGDGDAWFGTVWFKDAVLAQSNLGLGGNENSKILLSGCSGSLASAIVTSPVELKGDGMTVTDAADDSTVTFSSLIGSGAFTMDYGDAGEGSSFRVLDVMDFAGKIDVKTTKGTFVVGDGERTHDGAMEFVDGVSISSGGDWSAPTAYFGSTLLVNGHAGDAVVKISGEAADVGTVTVRFIGGDDERRRACLAHDVVNSLVYVKALPTPPTLDISGVAVDYGVDFTNATVSVSVSNFWSGIDFAGGAIAEYLVYDGNGNLIGYGSRTLDGDGCFVIGITDLPNGRGKDYRYDVVVNLDDESSGETEELESHVIAAPGARWDADWFHENSSTFAASAGSAEKTGDWKFAAGTAFITNETQIAVRTADAGGDVRFKPYVSATNDIVKIDMKAVLGECADPEAVAAKDPVAALFLADVPDSGDLAYGVWIPNLEESTGGRFETVYGASAPDPDDVCEVSVTMNRKSGYVTYAVDGNLLTNSMGKSSFVFRGSTDDIRAVGFLGNGEVEKLDGSMMNGNLAAVAFGGVTNEYETVDAAVAAAAAGGVSNVKVLWDATWRPAAANVGSTFVFDLTKEDGSKRTLVVDSETVETLERGGYRVIDNGNGSFTVGVYTFELSFAPNDATGSMPTQAYSITNMIFNLVSNKFVRSGSDFTGWNQFENGSGPTNWTDGAEIDMTPFGLTNMTLYAQWKAAYRTVIIEPADEFVYIERVATNGCADVKVRYYRDDASKATGSAAIEVAYGSDIEITFSTDLEKELTYATTNIYGVTSAKTLAYVGLPKILEDISPEMAKLINWANKYGIPYEDLATPYAWSSCELDLDHVMTAKSVVRITDFAIDDTVFSFRVIIDGASVTDLSKILPMVWLSHDLNSGWAVPSASEASVDEDGKVRIATGGPAFVKIVIPASE